LADVLLQIAHRFDRFVFPHQLKRLLALASLVVVI
jgi:hypothetical protein